MTSLIIKNLIFTAITGMAAPYYDLHSVNSLQCKTSSKPDPIVTTVTKNENGFNLFTVQGRRVIHNELKTTLSNQDVLPATYSYVYKDKTILQLSQTRDDVNSEVFSELGGYILDLEMKKHTISSCEIQEE